MPCSQMQEKGLVSEPTGCREAARCGFPVTQEGALKYLRFWIQSVWHPGAKLRAHRAPIAGKADPGLAAEQSPGALPYSHTGLWTKPEGIPSVLAHPTKGLWLLI